jgi:ABC-2 type transport system permease protein
MEKDYGEDQMKKFLSYELNGYLEGRGQERDEELPLMRVEDQDYIYYKKGSLAFYALRAYIGEEALNAALSRFVAATAFRGPPYTDSSELLVYLREATPEPYQYLLEDLFETITLYDNRTVEATVEKTADNHHEVRLAYESHKLRADGRGVETEIDHDDWIEIGIFGRRDGDEKGDECTLYLEKHRIGSGAGEIRITVDGEPARAGIDPRNLLIDRVPGDNLRSVSEGS